MPRSSARSKRAQAKEAAATKPVAARAPLPTKPEAIPQSPASTDSDHDTALDDRGEEWHGIGGTEPSAASDTDSTHETLRSEEEKGQSASESEADAVSDSSDAASDAEFIERVEKDSKAQGLWDFSSSDDESVYETPLEFEDSEATLKALDARYAKIEDVDGQNLTKSTMPAANTLDPVDFMAELGIQALTLDPTVDSRLNQLLTDAEAAVASNTLLPLSDIANHLDDTTKNPLFTQKLRRHYIPTDDLYISTMGGVATVRGDLVLAQNRIIDTAQLASGVHSAADQYDTHRDRGIRLSTKEDLFNLQQPKTTKPQAPKWSDIVTPEMTPAIKRDLLALKYRNDLNPHHSYKGDSYREEIPESFQIGTVVEAPHEFYSARMTRKERKPTLADQLISSVEARQSIKRRYEKMKQKQYEGSKKWYRDMRLKHQKRPRHD
ncbi:rrna-processing protein fcf2 [Dimargaris verticillata]|uniref:Rrna-processing protein fcf2 n=1 Tax=Dimargaris verticillata TaxID=2761393 RepID=A0A9W8B7B8_9FUNG|nr:rrna-processing protein fcf2 [Dimargaris verticillata]